MFEVVVATMFVVTCSYNHDILRVGAQTYYNLTFWKSEMVQFSPIMRQSFNENYCRLNCKVPRHLRLSRG